MPAAARASLLASGLYKENRESVTYLVDNAVNVNELPDDTRLPGHQYTLGEMTMTDNEKE